jgi:hypothetical protein
MPTHHRATRPPAATAMPDCGVLAVACLVTDLLVTTLLSRVYSLSPPD